MKNIGFIGLGNMGFEMIQNLSKGDYNLLAFDIDNNIYKKIQNSFIKTSQNIKNVFENSDIIITMLPNGEIIKKVIDENFKFVKKNSIIVDCSTIDIETTIYLHKLAKSFNLQSLDAPVSGGVAGAKSGSLTFMVGGNELTYELILPIFNLMGNKAIFCGGESSGQAVKICNNLILGITMIGVGEGINLARDLNLDLEKFYEVTSTSSASCWAINNYFPVSSVGPVSPADNSFVGGFSADLMKKDLSLAINASKSKKQKIKFGLKALEKYSKMIEKGMGSKDFSKIINHL